MEKDLAIFRLGGNAAEAAKWLGISEQVFDEWPERLHPLMVDRVYAGVLRRETARALGLSARAFFADHRGELVIDAMLSRVSLAAIMASMMERVPPEYAARSHSVEPEDKPRKRRSKPAKPRKTDTEALAPAVG